MSIMYIFNLPFYLYFYSVALLQLLLEIQKNVGTLDSKIELYKLNFIQTFKQKKN